MKIKHGVKSKLEDVAAIFTAAGCTLLATEYFNALTPMPFICECGAEHVIRLSKFKAGQRCPACAREKTREGLRSYSTEYVKGLFEEQGLEMLDWAGTNAQSTYRCRCGNLEKVQINTYQLHKFRQCKDCAKLESEAAGKRVRAGYLAWRRDVLDRDDYTCKRCGVGGSWSDFDVHHILSYTKYPALQLEVDNGLTLCECCHSEFHGLYGKFTDDQMLLDWGAILPCV